jgi:hypothetical protein
MCPVLKVAEPALGNFSDDPPIAYPTILEVASSAYAGRFPLKIQYFPMWQNAGQLAKMYSPNFVDNMVVAEVYSFRS